MSFASDARGEIARDACAHVCCARSEMAAALLASGGISFRGRDRYALSLTAAEGAVVRGGAVLEHGRMGVGGEGGWVGGGGEGGGWWGGGGREGGGGW